MRRLVAVLLLAAGCGSGPVQHSETQTPDPLLACVTEANKRCVDVGARPGEEAWAHA